MRKPKYELVKSAHANMVETTCRIADHNTLRYELEDGTVCYQLHETIIVKIYPDGKFRLDSGGWRTVTTKARMNEFMPGAYSLSQRNSVWYLARNSYERDFEEVVYYDGIIVDPNMPLKQDKKSEREVLRTKSIKKKITAFCKRLKSIIDEDGVPMPEPGDCLICQTGSNGDDHIISHVNEKYIHGSLIFRALADRRSEQSAALIMQMGHCDLIVKDVRNYLKRKLGLA